MYRLELSILSLLEELAVLLMLVTPVLIYDVKYITAVHRKKAAEQLKHLGVIQMYEL